jgi:hypothetical protein
MTTPEKPSSKKLPATSDSPNGKILLVQFDQIHLREGEFPDCLIKFVKYSI